MVSPFIWSCQEQLRLQDNLIREPADCFCKRTESTGQTADVQADTYLLFLNALKVPFTWAKSDLLHYIILVW